MHIIHIWYSRELWRNISAWVRFAHCSICALFDDGAPTAKRPRDGRTPQSHIVVPWYKQAFSHCDSWNGGVSSSLPSSSSSSVRRFVILSPHTRTRRSTSILVLFCLVLAGLAGSAPRLAASCFSCVYVCFCVVGVVRAYQFTGFSIIISSYSSSSARCSLDDDARAPRAAAMMRPATVAGKREFSLSVFPHTGRRRRRRRVSMLCYVLAFVVYMYARRLRSTSCILVCFLYTRAV